MIDKSVGERSTWCVDRIRRAVGKHIKVGHGGTLDSTASGALVILLGSATRLSEFVMCMKKVYVASIKLGVETSTCDFSGDVLRRCDRVEATEGEIDSALVSFIGWREQIPPKVSAVHVGGKRAHELARAGCDPDIAPRPVFVVSVTRISQLRDDDTFDIRVECGRGTYIRSIARDIGERLGCGAHIASLRRRSVGIFRADDALSLNGRDDIPQDEIAPRILPLSVMSEFFPTYAASRDASQSLCNGVAVELSSLARETPGSRSPADSILVDASDMFSICRLDMRDGNVCAVPFVNIAKEGRVL